MPACGKRRPAHRGRLAVESLETRNLMAAAPLPVLMVLPNRDFFAHESGDKQLVAEVAKNYSAIAFVGGWGASSYQYAFSGADSSAVSGPTTVADDVVVDGPIITAENCDAACAVDAAAVDQVLAAAQNEEPAVPELTSDPPASSPLIAKALCKNEVIEGVFRFPTNSSPATPLLHRVLVDNE
jgi:hypothetical protein